MTLATSLFTLRIAANGEMRQDCKQCSKSYVWKKGSGSGTLRQHYAASHPFALMKWQADSEQAAAATDDSSSVTSAAAATPAKRVASTDSSAESMPTLSSEAAVERTFSAQDAIHTKKRNRLYDSSIEASMFIAFNHRSMTRASQPHEKPCPESATKELSLEFMDTDTEMELPESEDEKLDTEEEKKEDVKLNWREDVDVEMAGEAAVAMRTQSEIDHDNRSFLEEFIAKHHITEWRGAYLLQLEAAALNHNVGGYSTKDLVLQIKSILRDNPPVVR
jgi:hypothetical protein